MRANLSGLSERLDLAPELRLTAYAYRELYGRPPAVLWQVPGTVTLLANGPLRLAVTARWGAIGAAGPRPDDVIELVRMDRPGEPARLTVSGGVAGEGPSWAGDGLRSAHAGAALLISSGAPEGSGLGAAAAAETAIRLCLRDAAVTGQDKGDSAPGGGSGPQARSDGAWPHALLGEKRLPFDLEAAGLRLMVIDTRVRDVPQPATVERAPLDAAVAALNAGDLEALGPLLTAAHAALPCDDVQQIAVSAALRAGALGARMLTDGPGRPACALLSARRLADVRAALLTEFTRRGLRTPRLLTIAPGGSPRRVEG